MSRSSHIVFTCDYCGEEAVTDYNDSFKFPEGWARVTYGKNDQHDWCGQCGPWYKE